jgi:nitroreductase
MQTWDAIRSRRNVRVFTERAIADTDLARTLLGHPEDRFCVALMSLGYPHDRPLVPIQRPDRRPFDEVVHRGRW